MSDSGISSRHGEQSWFDNDATEDSYIALDGLGNWPFPINSKDARSPDDFNKTAKISTLLPSE